MGWSRGRTTKSTPVRRGAWLDRADAPQLPQPVTRSDATTVAVRPTAERRPTFVVVTTLGAVTIAAYGVAYYSYGVLLDPIRSATGWSPTALAAVFSGVLAIGGVCGLAGGRLVDRLGTRPAFALAGSLGAGAIFAQPTTMGSSPSVSSTPPAAGWSARSASTTSPNPRPSGPPPVRRSAPSSG